MNISDMEQSKHDLTEVKNLILERIVKVIESEDIYEQEKCNIVNDYLNAILKIETVIF